MVFGAASILWLSLLGMERRKLLSLWPALASVDLLWALSPALLLHHISVGLAIACMPLLVYSPFAQRSLVLMGAAE